MSPEFEKKSRVFTAKNLAEDPENDKSDIFQEFL
jgi:hypothetical protein